MTAPTQTVGAPRWIFHPGVPTAAIVLAAASVALILASRGWSSSPAWVVLALAAGYSISGSP
ncbi:hypothetical protein ACOCJ7_03805 [Knoellia sp. CPCC 206453]|uniref:hypothetical protein n=1 Tax=Knoellia pratensis TaxID=3404796 RepID=UPI00361B6AB6